MQCKSYFPGHYSHYDLNVDANGGASSMYNGNATFRSGHYNEYMVPSPLPRGPPFAYKELLRRRMLLHEDTFKDQVQELHRLYRRQKELMDELKTKEMHMNRLHLEDQSLNSSSARYGQNVLHDLPFFKSQCTLSTDRDNTQTSHNSVKDLKPLAHPVASENGGTLDFAESRGRKIRGKLLDLELPAKVYIDSDEEESLQATPPTTLSPNKRAKVVVESDVKPFAANRSLNSVLQRELPSSCSSSRISTNLADLIKSPTMLCFEESNGDRITNSRIEISGINHDMCYSENSTPYGVADELTVPSFSQSDMTSSEVCFLSSDRKPHHSLMQNAPVVQTLPSLNSQFSFTNGAEISDGQKVHDKKGDASQWCSPNSRVTRPTKTNFFGSKLFEEPVCLVSAKNLDLNHIDLNSVTMSPSSSKISNVGECVRKSMRCRMIDINLPCDFLTDDDPHDLSRHDYRNSSQLNLNCYLNDDALHPKFSSLDQTRLETDLEAPISPEVSERFPHRGGSEENQLEEGSVALVELAKVAAETIVSISSSRSRPYPESMILQKCEASNCCNLGWFAGLVSSISIDADSDFAMICMETSIVDEYETMTLELTEMKVDDYWCKSTVQISSDICSISLPCQTRRDRTIRSKRKDFQREVLPSLASLSRYEVTEDIQMIGDLMEAAGTPWQLSRTRRACRMGRKPRVPKQQTLAEEVPELMAVMSWGKVNRRSRRRRSPASPTVLLNWFDYGIV